MEHLSPKIENQGIIAALLRVVDWLKFVLVLLIITEVILTCVNVVGSFDFPWQLNEGDYLLNHGYPIRSVLHAYGEISSNFQNEYILYEFLVSGLNHFMGWLGLCIFFGLLCLSIYFPTLLAFARSRNRFSVIDVFFFMLAQFIIDIRLSTRPELVADVCYVLTGMMLLSWPPRSWTGKQVLALGLVFFLWANAHGTFLLGIAMVGLWYGQFLLLHWKEVLTNRECRWMLPGLAAVIGCISNPFGFYRLIQPFQLHSLLWGQGTSFEMGPATSSGVLLLLIWTGAALLIVLIRVRERKYYWLFLMLLLLHYLTFTSIRYTLFIGLSLLIVAWDGLTHPRRTSLPSIFPLAFVTARCGIYFILVLGFFNLTQSLIYSKVDMLRNYVRDIYPKSRVVTSSSFNWMREHPSRDYNLLSYHSEGSLAQMPNVCGIHPLIDSGTHRYSDRTNQLDYYTFNSPEIFKRTLDHLHINAVAINNFNIYWAEVLNGDANWRLVQMASDSQLYLRKNVDDGDVDPKLFSDWDKSQNDPDKSPAVSSTNIIRGLKLRPDIDSLRMLTNSSDITWIEDPQVVYLKNWLAEVSDNLVTEALQRVQGKTDNVSMGLQILFLLRLHHDKDAAAIASQYQPKILSPGDQDIQLLRAEAFIGAGDLKTSRKILESFWPKPRYSLRWARLCQKVYANDPAAMPKNARLLVDCADQVEWQNDIIAVLNQNIKALTASP